MKHGYKRAIAMLLAATVMTGLTACGGGSSSGGGSGSASGGSGDGTFTASGKTLNVGVQSNIISIPTVYAEEKGYFDDLGLDVNLIMFPNGSPENEGLAAEQLDVASNGLASVYSTASGLCDWIAESDSGSITAKVYVRSGSPVLDHKGEISGKPDMYGSADTLKGLTVLGPTSTMEQWIANSYFAQFGLTAGSDYEYLNMDRAAAAQAILTGEGDVFVATDVDYCNMMESNNMVEVADCMEATDTEFKNGFLARKDILADRYDVWCCSYRACARQLKSCRLIRICATSLHSSSIRRTASRLTKTMLRPRPKFVRSLFRPIMRLRIIISVPVCCR